VRITISAAAQHHNAALGAHRLQGSSDRLRRMGEVHIDPRCARAEFDALHPTCDMCLPQTDRRAF
jgi:hypothetical protein